MPLCPKRSKKHSAQRNLAMQCTAKKGLSAASVGWDLLEISQNVLPLFGICWVLGQIAKDNPCCIHTCEAWNYKKTMTWACDKPWDIRSTERSTRSVITKQRHAIWSSVRVAGRSSSSYHALVVERRLSLPYLFLNWKPIFLIRDARENLQPCLKQPLVVFLPVSLFVFNALW